MREECLRAQEAISRALDGDAVTADEAGWAKHHCAECAECTAYVRTLAQLQAMPIPNAPENAVARTIAEGAALIEADRRIAEARAAAEPAAGSPADDASARAGSADTIASNSRVIEAAAATPPRRSTMSYAVWAASVAAILLVAMIVTAQGLRTINEPRSADSAKDATTLYSENQNDALTAQAPETGDVQQTETASRAPGYIVFDDTVYRFSGIVDEDTADLTRLGTLRTALDTGGTPQQRTAYGSDEQDRIYIEGNGIYAFVPVTRGFEDAVYVMRSDSVDAFGEWPTMPSGIPKPSELDGSPVFKIAGQSGGVSIYTRTGRNAQDGFAVAPNSPADDPAAGSPEWTWWEQQD